MKCIIDENDKFNYKSFVEQFHKPAEEIGFNFALLLTNLNEHMSNESRLNKFLEIGSEMLEYFKNTRPDWNHWQLEKDWANLFQYPTEFSRTVGAPQIPILNVNLFLT